MIINFENHMIIDLMLPSSLFIWVTLKNKSTLSSAEATSSPRAHLMSVWPWSHRRQQKYAPQASRDLFGRGRADDHKSRFLTNKIAFPPKNPPEHPLNTPKHCFHISLFMVYCLN
jgi:hypothetical protein